MCGCLVNVWLSGQCVVVWSMCGCLVNVWLVTDYIMVLILLFVLQKKLFEKMSASKQFDEQGKLHITNHFTSGGH